MTSLLDFQATSQPGNADVLCDGGGGVRVRVLGNSLLEGPPVGLLCRHGRRESHP